jgi:carbon monoxide dehydrogenase subunit G
MPRLHEEIVTTLSADVAFPFIADFANSSRWDPGVASSKQIGDRPLGLGARFMLDVRMGGRTSPMEYEITTYEPNRLVVLTGRGSGVSAVDEIRFEPSSTGTHIDYTADIRLGGLLRLATPFLGGAFAKIAKDALGGMKVTLDAMAAER